MDILDETHTLVGTLLQLAVVRSLLNEVEQVLGKGLVGEGPGYKIHQYVAIKARMTMCLPPEVSDIFKM